MSGRFGRAVELPHRHLGEGSTFARTVAAVGVVTSAQVTISKVRKAVLNRWDAAQEAKIYIVTVSDEEPVWNDIQAQLLKMLPEPDQRTLAIRCNTNSATEPVSVVYQGKRTHEVVIDGHTIAVTMIDGAASGKPVKRKTRSGGDGPVAAAVDSISSRNMDGGGSNWGPKLQNVQFDCPSIEARDAVVAWVGKLAAARRQRENPPTFNIVSPWNGWNELSHITPRPLSTVVLPEGVVEGLVDDIRLFLDSREVYENAGLPWHRGYIFFGPPGAGKTSLIRGLATELGLDLWYAPLGEQRSDTDLLNLVTRIRGGMLLLEDIDAFDAVQSRETPEPTTSDANGNTVVTVSAPSVTLTRSAGIAGLLNALDGVATPPGLIVAMTTNYIDRIDPAILRPGRCDVHTEVGYLTDREALGVFNNLYHRPPVEPFPTVNGLRFTAADLIESCKLVLRDPTAGENAFRLAILERTSKLRRASQPPIHLAEGHDHG